MLNDRVDTHHKKGVWRPSHCGFTARTLVALHGIVEQDWKREMQKERELEEQVCDVLSINF